MMLAMWFAGEVRRGGGANRSRHRPWLVWSTAVPEPSKAQHEMRWDTAGVCGEGRATPRSQPASQAARAGPHAGELDKPATLAQHPQIAARQCWCNDASVLHVHISWSPRWASGCAVSAPPMRWRTQGVLAAAGPSRVQSSGTRADPGPLPSVDGEVRDCSLAAAVRQQETAAKAAYLTTYDDGTGQAHRYGGLRRVVLVARGPVVSVEW